MQDRSTQSDPRSAPRRRAALPWHTLLALALAACGGDGGASTTAGAEVAPPAAPPLELPMVTVEAATFVLDGEEVTVPAFQIDAFEVTNDAFAAFVEATDHVTDAEVIGDSVVFDYDWQRSAESRSLGPFVIVEGADWRHPEGPGSDLRGRGDHPVVHVSWRDASAFARWRGCRLPTDAEWVSAARGGQEDPVYPWGTELRPGRRHMMNAWQGVFPTENQDLDRYLRTAPVGSFPATGFGTFDLAGNVWEWTGTLVDPRARAEERFAFARGGSFLCRERAEGGYAACQGYRIEGREAKPVIDGNNHVGFRCARDLPASR